MYAFMLAVMLSMTKRMHNMYSLTHLCANLTHSDPSSHSSSYKLKGLRSLEFSETLTAMVICSCQIVSLATPTPVKEGSGFGQRKCIHVVAGVLVYKMPCKSSAITSLISVAC